MGSSQDLNSNTNSIQKQSRRLRQRTLLVILLVILIFAGIGVWQWGEMQRGAGGSDSSGANSEVLMNLNELGDPIDPEVQSPELSPGVSENDVYSGVLEQMLECLDIQAPKPTAESIQIDQLLKLVEPTLGRSQIVERWRAWHLKDHQDRERRVRIETVENDDGQVSRELHYYGVDAEGQIFPVELDPRDVMNPSEEMIQSVLAKGKVFYQEVAMAGLFPGGERIEYINKNGKLAEIEFLKSDRVFNCQSVVRPSTCVCTR